MNGWRDGRKEREELECQSVNRWMGFRDARSDMEDDACVRMSR